MTRNDPSAIPEAAVRHKKAGARHFAAADYKSSLRSYRSALSCLPGEGGGRTMRRPDHEGFALTICSNAALCLLRMSRPREAADECAAAMSLPIFQVSAPEATREKVLARRAEALLDWLAEAEKGGDGDMDIDSRDAPTEEAIWSVLDEARLRGYVSKDRASSVAVRKKFLHLGATLQRRAFSAQQTTKTEAELGVDGWTDRMVRTGTVTAADAKRARDAVKSAAAAEPAAKGSLEVCALDAMDSLIPRPSLSVEELCRTVISLVVMGESPTVAVSKVRTAIRDGNLHPAAVADDGTGYLLWAICFALGMSPPGDGPTDTFIALLALLVDELGVSIDQRAPSGSGGESRNPLQYVAKSGRPRAVRAMLDRGARVNLCDEEGWTALSAVCMSDVKSPDEGGPSEPDRVKTAKILMDAGADIEAASSVGFTPLIAACMNPCVPLIRFLLSRGANKQHRSDNGFTPASVIEGAKNPDVAEKCRQLLLEGDEDAVVSEDTKAVRFDRLIREVVVPAHNNVSIKANLPLRFDDSKGRSQRAEQERIALSALMEHVGIDPKLLHKRLTAEDGNWLETLHSRVMAMIPDAYVKVYCNELPSETELSMVTSHSKEAWDAGNIVVGGVRRFDKEAATKAALKSWRERGLVFGGIMRNYEHAVVDSIQHSIGFAVPSEIVLQRIESCGAVVEVGAGTGYWSAVLRSRGVDALPYDAHPPTADHEASFFFDNSYTDIMKGDATKLFEGKGGAELSQRALLIVWPNNPDQQDNPHLYQGEAMPPVWDSDCLANYVTAGGRTVIYVGEREDRIRVVSGAKPDCGLSSSRRFQSMLKEHFRLVERHDCPKWSHFADDVTIWKR